MEGERIWAEIALENLKENIRLIKRETSAPRLLLAVKADAYGHGAVEIAQYLKGEVSCFGVASVEEGISLREKGTKGEILVLSPLPYSRIPLLFEYALMPTVTEEDFLRLLAKEAKRLRKVISVYLEVDTGMGRTGLLPEAARKAIDLILDSPLIRLVGIFSHFPSADSERDFTLGQISSFRKFIGEVREKLKPPVFFSLANSAGIINFPSSHLQMTRPGLLAYGIAPESLNSGKREGRENLASKVRPVLSLYSRIVNLRHLPKGASVSYNRRFKTERDSLIGVVACGYGDGVPYNLTNRGEVLVKGKRARIVGQVCMDLMMVDLSSLKGVKIGDRVTLIGQEGKEEITVKDLAFWANTIPYEILCRISPRVKRVFKEKGRVLWVR